MSDYEFKLPWPPSINSYWATFRGRRLISKKGRLYAKEVDQILDDLNLKGEMISNRLCVHITLNPPTLRKYDVDNFNKCLFDALSKSGFWVDDEQVVKLTIEKGIKTPPGNAVVKVTVYG